MRLSGYFHDWLVHASRIQSISLTQNRILYKNPNIENTQKHIEWSELSPDAQPAFLAWDEAVKEAEQVSNNIRYGGQHAAIQRTETLPLL